MVSDDDPPADAPVEYRIEQLATLTGTTVRTLQSYRNKGLLPPPRRAGRVVLFTDVHVERLALIADLIARGYSLGAVAELLDGLDRDERVRDLLGLDEEVSRTADDVVVTPRQVAQQIPEGVDALEKALGIGMFTPVEADHDGNPADQPLVVLLPEVLRAGAALAAAGIPSELIIEEGVALRRDADVIARRLVTLVVDHLIAEGRVRGPATTSAATVSELALGLLPHASSAVAELVEAAMRAQVHEVVDQQLAQLLAEGDGLS